MIGTGAKLAVRTGPDTVGEKPEVLVSGNGLADVVTKVTKNTTRCNTASKEPMT